MTKVLVANKSMTGKRGGFTTTSLSDRKKGSTPKGIQNAVKKRGGR